MSKPPLSCRSSSSKNHICLHFLCGAVRVVWHASSTGEQLKHASGLVSKLVDPESSVCMLDFFTYWTCCDFIPLEMLPSSDSVSTQVH